eukprot:TRINITY_DN46294_c0_g1_i1.p1 TRINITY_DN46294_c0_g1~~TRINITY_DN46294_c0_g1_i1.p1  ORF type:complete len:595 (-),score=135.67 TRINITY_DN46294_c0_g1_i1:510-2294(-)
MPAVEGAAMDEDRDRGHLYGYRDPAAKKTRLQEIVEQREKDVAEAKAKVSIDDVRKAAAAFTAEFGQPQSLVECIADAETKPWGLGLAAEFKRASPSKGDINADLNAAEQALEYSKVGACMLSVLTEPKWFKGTLGDLRDVRVQTQAWASSAAVRRPACLRKDFLVDEYQVLEAVAHGADTALLMVSILSRTRLQALIACCRENELEPLVEVVTMKELEVALDAGARVLGVNNRNLHTFELDKGRTAEVAKALKETYNISFGRGAATKLLALSGLSTADDVAHCREIGCSGILVGEALMRAPDPGAAILSMMGPSSSSSQALPVEPGSVVVKVCGVVREEDAGCAIGAGANLIGVIFAKSKRQASVEQATSVVNVVRRFGERSSMISAPHAKSDGDDVIKALARRCCALRQASKRTPLIVGVFMDQGLEEVVKIAAATGVDAVQLHGGEDVAFVQELRKQLPDAWVIKVVHLPPRGSAEAEDSASEAELGELKRRLLAYGEHCDGLLLDTAVKGAHSGGTGAAFDWKVAQKVQDEWGVPIIVAGGLTDGNVGELVSTVNPFGVDVASGVEDAPGEKNVEKTKGYVHGAKRARTS